MGRQCADHGDQADEQKKTGQKVKFNRAWYIFFGLKLGLTRQETLATDYGEFCDLLSCLSIYNGAAREVKKWTYDEAINLR